MERDTGAALDVLLEVCSRLPVPDPGWHPHARAIGAVRADFEHAVEIAQLVPEVLEEVARSIDADDLAALAPSAGPELRAAWARLEALPVPEGRHPFLDEIVAALEAAKVTLAAVGRSAEASRRFERRPVAAAA
jgi:hypothetical protein